MISILKGKKDTFKHASELLFISIRTKPEKIYHDNKANLIKITAGNAWMLIILLCLIEKRALTCFTHVNPLLFLHVFLCLSGLITCLLSVSERLPLGWNSTLSYTPLLRPLGSLSSQTRYRTGHWEQVNWIWGHMVTPLALKARTGLCSMLHILFGMLCQTHNWMPLASRCKACTQRNWMLPCFTLKLQLHNLLRLGWIRPPFATWGLLLVLMEG